MHGPSIAPMDAMEAAAHLPAAPEQRLQALASLRTQLQGEGVQRSC